MTNQSETQHVSKLVALKSRPPMSAARAREYSQDRVLRSHEIFCEAVFCASKFLIMTLIIGGTRTILRGCVHVASFLFKNFNALAQFIFNGPKKREERFWKGYAVVVGSALALMGNGIYLNIKSDIAWGKAYRAELPAITAMLEKHATMKATLASYRVDSGETLLNDVLYNEANRLELSCSTEEAVRGLRTFLNYLVELESKGDAFAISHSGAVGYTQFLRTYRGRFDRGPIDTALTRWGRYTGRHNINPHTNWFDRAHLRENANRFMGIPLAAQQAFALVNIAEEDGNDVELAKAACGDARAATHLYVFNHHRDPGKEKHIFRNIEGKISLFYPDHGLDLSQGLRAIT